MKQNDIIAIGLAIVFSVIVSYFVSSKVIITPNNRQQQVEVVSPISQSFPTLSSQYFNSKSIDLTQLIQISNNSNQTPFGTKTQ